VGLFVLVAVVQSAYPETPHWASIFAGLRYFLLVGPLVVAIVVGIGISDWVALFAGAFMGVPYFAIAGYVVGILVGGIFLVADRVRQFLAQREPRL
jgi:hypothetical protein